MPRGDRVDNGARRIRVLDSLLSDGALVCPRCRVGLAYGPSQLACENCGSSYAVRHGVADFLEYRRARRLTRKPRVDPAAIDGIVGVLQLPATSETRATVEQICRGSARTLSERALTAEVNDLLDRFGLGGEVAHPSLTRRQAASVNVDVSVRYERHYVEGRLPLDAVLQRNVRMTNIGRSVWSSRVEPPLHMSYRWVAEDGGTIPIEGERTAFPVDVVPGRTISMPMRIRTPQQSGKYALAVMPVHEMRRWVEDQAFAIPVVVEGTAGALADLDIELDRDTVLSYEADHEAGMQFLRSFLANRFGATTPLRLLEVGGGAHPQAAALRHCEIVNIDISSPLLELGAMYFGERYDRELCFICCDALDPPFAPGTFDGVVMFATLHHFGEPERLLDACRALVRPGGFIAVLCEPAGGSLAGPETVRDLLKGINEQTFSVHEYLDIGRAAGLELRKGRVDGDSFKAVFAPAF